MKTCPSCGAQAPGDERVCQSCGNPFPVASVKEDARVVQLRKARERKEREEARRFWETQRRQAQARRARSGAWNVWAGSPATVVLMGLTLLLSLIPALQVAAEFQTRGLLQAALLLFVNPGLLAIVFSLLFLYFIGGQLERMVPLTLFLVVFFGSGLIGGYVEVMLNMAPVGLGPALWGMVGAIFAWDRLRGHGGYSTQWVTTMVIATVVLNLFLLNFNIGALIVQIVLTIAIGAGIVYLWQAAPWTRRMR